MVEYYSHKKDFHEISYLGFSLKHAGKFGFCSKLDKNTGDPLNKTTWDSITATRRIFVKFHIWDFHLNMPVNSDFVQNQTNIRAIL